MYVMMHIYIKPLLRLSSRCITSVRDRAFRTCSANCCTLQVPQVYSELEALLSVSVHRAHEIASNADRHPRYTISKQLVSLSTFTLQRF